MLSYLRKKLTDQGCWSPPNLSFAPTSWSPCTQVEHPKSRNPEKEPATSHPSKHTIPASLEFSFLTAVKSSSTPALKYLSQRGIGAIRERFQLKIPYNERLLVCFLCKCGSCIVRISIFSLTVYSETKILMGNWLRWSFGRTEEGIFENMSVSFSFIFLMSSSAAAHSIWSLSGKSAPARALKYSKGFCCLGFWNQLLQSLESKAPGNTLLFFAAE